MAFINKSLSAYQITNILIFGSSPIYKNYFQYPNDKSFENKEIWNANDELEVKQDIKNYQSLINDKNDLSEFDNASNFLNNFSTLTEASPLMKLQEKPGQKKTKAKLSYRQQWFITLKKHFDENLQYSQAKNKFVNFIDYVDWCISCGQRKFISLLIKRFEEYSVSEEIKLDLDKIQILLTAIIFLVDDQKNLLETQTSNYNKANLELWDTLDKYLRQTVIDSSQQSQAAIIYLLYMKARKLTKIPDAQNSDTQNSFLSYFKDQMEWKKPISAVLSLNTVLEKSLIRTPRKFKDKLKKHIDKFQDENIISDFYLDDPITFTYVLIEVLSKKIYSEIAPAEQKNKLQKLKNLYQKLLPTLSRYIEQSYSKENINNLKEDLYTSLDSNVNKELIYKKLMNNPYLLDDLQIIKSEHLSDLWEHYDGEQLDAKKELFYELFSNFFKKRNFEISDSTNRVKYRTIPKILKLGLVMGERVS